MKTLFHQEFLEDQAARILGGERPAEVRFDEDDREIADAVAKNAVEFICREVVRIRHEESKEHLQDAIFNAIRDYAHWQHDRRQGGGP